MGRNKVARAATGRWTVFVLVLVWPVLLLGLSHSTEAVTRPVLRGYLDRYPKDVAQRLGIEDLKGASSGSSNASGTVVFDTAIDRGYQMWSFDEADGTDAVAVGEIDLSTLKVVRLVKIPNRELALPGGQTEGRQFLNTIDTKNHILYLQTEIGGGWDATATPREIIALDLATFRYTLNEIPLLVGSGPVIFGMQFDEIGENLILTVPALKANPTLTGNPVTLIGWRAADFDGGPLPGPGGMLGPRVLRNCRRDPVNAPGLNSDIASPMMITTQPDAEANLQMRTWVFIPCLTTPVSLSTAIVRLNHATLFDPNATDERLIPAPPAISNWSVDEKRGRFLLVNEADGADGWVYEASTNAYIGVIQISGSGLVTGFGVDEESGRLYAYNQSNGLMIAEMGQDPIPQADPYRIDLADSGWPMPIDVRRNKVFVIPKPEARAHRYEIYEVPPPVKVDVKIDADSLTKQVKEEAGKTDAQYGGSATAYGVRSLLAGGLAGAIPTSGNNDLGRVLREINSRCGLRDREVVLAAIQQTDLQNSGREAKAAGVHLDNASVQDLERPSRCDVYNEAGLGFSLLGVEKALETLQFGSLYGKLDGIGGAPGGQGYADWVDKTLGDYTKWEYRAATCSKPIAQAGHNSDQLAGPTSVSCDKPGLVSAASEARAREDVIGPITIGVGKAYTTTEVHLDPARGLVSEATSVVENFKIGQVTIGYISNSATSFAKGRSGTSGTDKYEPVISGLRGSGITGCELRCDVNTAIAQLNTAFAGRVEFRTIKPDPILLKGSPGGYQAGIIKSEKQRSSDNALVGDKSSEVPALEVIIYNDNPRLGRIRQVIQLAGVHVDSQYGIQSFDEGTACPECGFGSFESEGDFGILEPEFESVSDAPADPGGFDLIETIRRVIGGIAEGIQVLIANPREAAVLATVWALLLGPYVLWRRSRLLATLAN